ncbi:MAG: iron-containing alcohol dehydrogenase [Candidatus Omnitrophica bacterium]|nr:iron-containing alcohol dehydrogenase [Candidatus Omnitrophota bacterium]MBU1047726.1 iron-containing alcohol dehydrogenase [Candidatus Omnitrophota bacterium]MBU1631006.1 iron-containing alcohol dehydrogenase [Candidatus Omnitrophota bacterium]MBU1888544.1 iron-containing alcohol dehydrogenase [Candidatus Omnitrophota bacterium]
MDFNFELPKVNLLFGKGVSVKISEEVKKLGDNVLLVTGRNSMDQLGFTQKIIDHLKNHVIKVTVFNKITPNPTTELVDEGAKVALENKCNVIIGLGGGSSIDAAKAIAIVAGHSSTLNRTCSGSGQGEFQSIWAFSPSQSTPLPITSKTLPIVAITSSSGTGSHVTRFSVITNLELKQKMGIYSQHIFPKLSVVDLEILTNMPPALTAECGVDVLTHCLEGLVSKNCNPITEEMALKGIELVFNYLTDTYRNGDNIRSRGAMALADTYAGFVITTSRVVLPHAMSHPISAYYPNISHGAALAALTPHIMQFNIENGDNTTLQKYCLASGAMGKRAFGTNKYEAMKSVEAVKELLKKIGMDKGLQELGVDPGSINNMVKSAMVTGQGPIESNPVEVKENDIVRIYKLSLGK